MEGPKVCATLPVHHQVCPVPPPVSASSPCVPHRNEQDHPNPTAEARILALTLDSSLHLPFICSSGGFVYLNVLCLHPFLSIPKATAGVHALTSSHQDFCYHLLDLKSVIRLTIGAVFLQYQAGQLTPPTCPHRFFLSSEQRRFKPLSMGFKASQCRVYPSMPCLPFTTFPVVIFIF